VAFSQDFNGSVVILDVRDLSDAERNQSI